MCCTSDTFKDLIQTLTNDYRLNHLELRSSHTCMSSSDIWKHLWVIDINSVSNIFRSILYNQLIQSNPN